jgi:hypothetical protein
LRDGARRPYKAAVTDHLCDRCLFPQQERSRRDSCGQKAPRALILSHFSLPAGSLSLSGWLTKWLEKRLQTISWACCANVYITHRTDSKYYKLISPALLGWRRCTGAVERRPTLLIVNTCFFLLLTSELNEAVGSIHPKAMPVILTTLEEYDV